MEISGVNPELQPFEIKESTAMATNSIGVKRPQPLTLSCTRFLRSARAMGANARNAGRTMALLAILLLHGGGSMAAQEEQSLTFIASYRGLFSAGLEVDIGRIELRLEATGQQPPDILMLASTRDFDAAELIMPVRFCYRSRRDPDDQGVRQADWWSLVGNKAARGQLLADRRQRRVTRLHSEVRLAAAAGAGDSSVLPQQPAPQRADQDLDRRPFPAAGAPLDRLGVIQQLRDHPPSVGASRELPATNGRHLVGYRTFTEARETLDWNGRSLTTLRLRIEPVVDDDSPDRPVWLWVSDDEQRLPLRLRSTQVHGRFEMRLVTDEVGTGVRCPVPEAEGLALPGV